MFYIGKFNKVGQVVFLANLKKTKGYIWTRELSKAWYFKDIEKAKERCHEGSTVYNEEQAISAALLRL